jgi:hypothetical protein
MWRLLRLFGLICLTVLMFTHVAERFQLFPSMGWGQPDSPRNYIDLVSAILGCTLLALGLLGNAATGSWRR